MKQIHRRYGFLLVLSLCLHIALYMAVLMLWKPDTPQEPEPSIRISLRTPPPPEQPVSQPSSTQPDTQQQEKQQEKQQEEEQQDESPEPETHAPMSNDEAFASDNQEDESVTEVDPGALVAPEERQEPQSNAQANTQEEGASNEGRVSDVPVDGRDEKAARQDKVARDIPDYRSVVDTHAIDMDAVLNRQAPTQTEDADAQSDSHARSAVTESLEQHFLGHQWLSGDDQSLSSDISDFIIEEAGNAVLLSEAELREQIVKSPFSEKREKELRMANKYLDRMSKQVYELWINPYKGTRQLKGIIWMEIDEEGYLVEADIHRTSGDRLLDISVLDAIRAVRRFEVPDDPAVVRKYYTNLRFHYSSLQEQPELMPYQKEQN